MSNQQPSPELLNAVGHAILRSVAIGQGDILRHAAGAIERLERMLSNASSEARLIAVLMSLTDDPTPQPVVASPAPQPTSQSQPARRTSQPAKASRKSKAALPVMDASGRLQPSRRIGDVDVVSQATARKALGISCLQMLRLEDQKLLTRIQEPSSRLVHYSTVEVQKLLNLIDRGADPEPDATPTDGVV